MTTDSEIFSVAVYDKNLVRQGWVADPESLVVTPRHNQQGSGSLIIASDHKNARALMMPGARVTVHYRDEYLMGGPVRLIQSQGFGNSRGYTFSVIDDWRLLTRLLGWPNPSGAITAQGADGAYNVRTGPAETVLKGFLSANLTRVGSGTFGLPVSVPASLGRGSTITVQMRMHKQADRLFPLVDQAGIGVRVVQTLTGLEVQCYVPQVWPIQLSEDGGTLTANDWSMTPPEVTRIVVMASGVAEARVMRGPFINTVAENLYRDWIEESIDARDIASTDPAFEALITARANERLAEGAAKAGLAIQLSENDSFQYGGTNGVHVGDVVNMELAPATDTYPAIIHTDVLRSATLSLSAQSGPSVTPVVGDLTDDVNGIVFNSLAAITRRQRNQEGG